MTRARLVGILFFFKESVTLLSWKVNMNLLDHCGRHELSHISSPGNLQKSLEGRKEGRDINPGVARNQDEVYKLTHPFVYSSIYLASCLRPTQSCCEG